MGKRQKRINMTEGYTSWVPYLRQEVNVVCASGIVYHGLLVLVQSDVIAIQDFSGNHFRIAFTDLKELIVDYVSS